MLNNIHTKNNFITIYNIYSPLGCKIPRMTISD